MQLLIFPGKYLKYTDPVQPDKKDLHSFVPSFEWLRPGDRIGLKRTAESKVLVYYNSELLDVAFEKVPDVSYKPLKAALHIPYLKKYI